jgi:hypothetical protein
VPRQSSFFDAIWLDWLDASRRFAVSLIRHHTLRHTDQQSRYRVPTLFPKLRNFGFLDSAEQRELFLDQDALAGDSLRQGVEIVIVQRLHPFSVRLVESSLQCADFM